MSRDILLKLEELININLIDSIDINEELDIKTVNKVESRLFKKTSEEFDIDLFYKKAFSVLGYDNILDIVEFANEKNIYLMDKTNQNNKEFVEFIYSLLEAKSSCGIKLISKLCQESYFDDFNDAKDIPERFVFNNQTQPIFNCEEAIFEKVYIETPLDTDEDGKRDLILTFIKRPKETNEGMKAPIIYIANPYMMGGDDDNYILHGMDNDLETIKETNLNIEDVEYRLDEEKLNVPSPREIKGQTTGEIVPRDTELEAITPWYDYLLSRGYAIVMAGGIGTRGSEGIRNCGGVEEVISTISVVDWLNHRLPAFSDKENDLEVKAFWSNGNVGMTGKSYLGTLAIAASTTGVDGLKTIVPEAAISNWYDYYRKEGLLYSGMEWSGDDCDLLSSYCFSRIFDEDQKYMNEFFGKKQDILRDRQDRVTGNYNVFWDERNYAKNAEKVKCSVFIVHGLKDWNVKPLQFDNIWRALENNNVSRKMVLHQGDHIYINDNETIDFSQMMNKWYDHYLLDIQNNIDEEQPNVMIQNNLDQNKWDCSNTWPYNNDNYKDLYIGLNATLGQDLPSLETENKVIVDNVLETGYIREDKNYKVWLDNLVKQDQKSYKVMSFTEKLEEEVRVSGTVKVKINASCNKTTGVLSAMLVNYGNISKSLTEIEEVENVNIELGKGAKALPAKKFKTLLEKDSYDVITRGSINIQNREGIINKKEVKENEFYEYEIKMEPMDYTVVQGNKLGLIIYSTDPQFTVIPFNETEFNIDLSSIVLSIPC